MNFPTDLPHYLDFLRSNIEHEQNRSSCVWGVTFTFAFIPNKLDFCLFWPVVSIVPLEPSIMLHALRRNCYGGLCRPPSPLITSETLFLNHTKELSYLFQGDPSVSENSPSGFPEWLGCLMSLLRLNRKKKIKLWIKDHRISSEV